VLSFAGVVIRCRWCLLALAFVVVIVGVGVHEHWRWLALALAFVVGGVVALGDVALGSGVVSCCCRCCCPETGPIATLRAEAHSGSVGLGRKMEAGRQQVGDESRF
jgi:hypothetical protein